MSAPAAIQATFSDFKVIRGRKVCQIIMELPLEHADAALATLGGLPRPDAERWFAIARLDLKAASEPEKPRKPFETLSAAQQAGIRCNDPIFQKYMGARDADDAARLVRDFCMVKSRSELATNDKAAREWRKLDDEFFKEQRGFR